MIIKEENFIIKYVSGNYVLFIKSKDKFKVEGYFTSIINCIKRLSKIKGFSSDYYKSLFKDIKNTKIQLKKYSNCIYNPIKQLDQEINGVRSI